MRQYNIITDILSEYNLVLLAEVDERYVADSVGTEKSIDTIARDRLEFVATVVKPPGRSAKHFDPEIFSSYSIIVASRYD